MSFLRRQAVIAALTANAVRPHPGPTAGILSFFAGAAFGELAPQVLALTAADTVAHVARGRRSGRVSRPGLALAAVSADLIWSNLALHWHPQPHQVFQEWRRVLRVDGLLMFSCFGPDTFRELREAWAGIDGAPHTLPGETDYHALNAMLNLYDADGKIQFEKDVQAAHQYFREHVNQHTVFFHDVDEKLD